MQIFKNYNQTLATLRELPFKLEKEIQTLFEMNLEVLTSLKLVKSEFIIKQSRVDTLAFDTETKAFVIIEYKRGQNYSVVDQGVSYLNLMLEYKADFIVEYNEVSGQSLKRDEVDWSQSRVIFVSPSFTEFQKQSTNFKDLGIELWEIKRFENELVTVSQVRKSKSAPSIKPMQKGDESQISKLAKEIKVYSEEDHLKGKSDEVVELYESFKNSIQNLGSDIEIKPQKMVIGFTFQGKILADVLVLKSELKFWINLKWGKLDDKKQISRNVSNIGHWGNGDYEIRVSDTKNLEYIMSLVKQTMAH